jgi:hypothetical protein
MSEEAAHKSGQEIQNQIHWGCQCLKHVSINSSPTFGSNGHRQSHTQSDYRPMRSTTMLSLSAQMERNSKEYPNMWKRERLDPLSKEHFLCMRLALLMTMSKKDIHLERSSSPSHKMNQFQFFLECSRGRWCPFKILSSILSFFEVTHVDARPTAPPP